MEMMQTVVKEMAKFCETVLAPLSTGGDRVGCKYVDKHTVITPPGFKDAYTQWWTGGWSALAAPEEYGGQGMPPSLGLIVREMTATANWSWTMYPGLSLGAMNTLIMHATPELQKKYLPKLCSGEWIGTMCLTEPQCGSDLAQVKTRAVPNGDGTYKITGTKIFISCGEHDMTDNIVHCVLARLPNAPEGIKGISLFLVPKKHVNDDGVVGDHNGVNIGRIENKMGCHGSSTCEINFEDAQGWLLGKEHKGMHNMFTFINTSRVGTAVQGVAAAEASYQNALRYARERCSMRALSGTKNPSGVADPIVYHPDVRKMLLTQKAFAEGGRSMLYECVKVADHLYTARNDEAEWKKIDDRLGFLTPILKGFLTERGVEAASLGMQVFGGHGYIVENTQEQIFRDVRISALWEGTTGIQALDLLGRKVMLQKLEPLRAHTKELRQFATSIMRDSKLSKQTRLHAVQIYLKSFQWHMKTVQIAKRALSDREAVGLASYDYLMYSGYVTMGAHWLRMAAASERALQTPRPDGLPKEFYQAKIQTANFYFNNILPRATTHAKVMTAPIASVMEMPVSNFSTEY
eukprot:gnl/Spiro4/4166_TR2082_c0_g1_i1.p1 gnl/Spiro4/4166_TR2082_c0_g1~~gnl/Spiro4/4166_TR2082_c0_g1_i1.p1  ORF type:complete len:647 (-),score=125.03 gnl/Spiro4/4166_TR2082_c0_g1_i1:108-1835(-)